MQHLNPASYFPRIITQEHDDLPVQWRHSVVAITIAQPVQWRRSVVAITIAQLHSIKYQ